jgi:hypothetical protein
MEWEKGKYEGIVRWTRSRGRWREVGDLICGQKGEGRKYKYGKATEKKKKALTIER